MTPKLTIIKASDEAREKRQPLDKEFFTLLERHGFIKSSLNGFCMRVYENHNENAIIISDIGEEYPHIIEIYRLKKDLKEAFGKYLQGANEFVEDTDARIER